MIESFLKYLQWLRGFAYPSGHYIPVCIIGICHFEFVRPFCPISEAEFSRIISLVKSFSGRIGIITAQVCMCVALSYPIMMSWDLMCSHVFSCSCVVQSARSKIGNRCDIGMCRLQLKPWYNACPFFQSIFCICLSQNRCWYLLSIQVCPCLGLQSYQYLCYVSWDYMILDC